MFRRDPPAIGDDRADDFGAGLMTVGPVLAACLGPPPVAVHDDGDMARQGLVLMDGRIAQR